MDDRCMFLLGAVVFLAFGVIVCIVRACREKDKDYYKAFCLGAEVAFLALLAFVSVILQQHLLAWLFLFCGAAVAVVGMPKTDKLIERKTAEHLQGVDISAPLRARDFMHTGVLLKTAYRWGVWKTMFLFWLLWAAAIVGVVLITGLWLGWIDVDFIVACTFSSTIPMTAMYYRAISKALKSIEIGKET